MKEKIKTNFKIVLAAFIIIFEILSYLAPNIYALVRNGQGEAEVFLDDLEENSWVFNSRSIPYLLFKDYNLSLWCANPDGRIIKWLTAKKALYDAYYSNSWGAELYNPDAPLHYYKHEGNMGLVDEVVPGGLYQGFVDLVNRKIEVYRAQKLEHEYPGKYLLDNHSGVMTGDLYRKDQEILASFRTARGETHTDPLAPEGDNQVYASYDLPQKGVSRI